MGGADLPACTGSGSPTSSVGRGHWVDQNAIWRTSPRKSSWWSANGSTPSTAATQPDGCIRSRAARLKTSASRPGSGGSSPNTTSTLSTTFRTTGTVRPAILERKQRRRLLNLILSKMTEVRRATFTLFRNRRPVGRGHRRIQGVPVNTVWSRLQKARKQFIALAALYLNGQDSASAGQGAHEVNQSGDANSGFPAAFRAWTTRKACLYGLQSSATTLAQGTAYAFTTALRIVSMLVGRPSTTAPSRRARAWTLVSWVIRMNGVSQSRARSPTRIGETRERQADRSP